MCLNQIERGCFLEGGVTPVTVNVESQITVICINAAVVIVKFTILVAKREKAGL